MNTQRLVEAAVIGVVLAFIGFVAIVPRLEERIDRVLDAQINIRAEVILLEQRLNLIESTRFTEEDGREIRTRMRELEKRLK